MVRTMDVTDKDQSTTLLVVISIIGCILALDVMDIDGRWNTDVGITRLREVGVSIGNWGLNAAGAVLRIVGDGIGTGASEGAYSSPPFEVISLQEPPPLMPRVVHQPAPAPPVMTGQAPPVDMVFVLDSTGSMSDEITTVKLHIERIVAEARDGDPQPDLRVGLVTYRDHPPEERDYLLRTIPLTHNIDSFTKELVNVNANGGGDSPEAVVEGLKASLSLDWRPRASKIVFLIGDAPPYGHCNDRRSRGDHLLNVAHWAADMGIVVYPLSGSGMGPCGVGLWQEVARITGGTYEMLVYERRNVQKEYEGRGTPLKAWQVAEMRREATFDAENNTVLDNQLAIFARDNIAAQVAREQGVKYSR